MDNANEEDIASGIARAVKGLAECALDYRELIHHHSKRTSVCREYRLSGWEILVELSSDAKLKIFAAPTSEARALVAQMRNPMTSHVALLLSSAVCSALPPWPRISTSYKAGAHDLQYSGLTTTTVTTIMKMHKGDQYYGPPPAYSQGGYYGATGNRPSSASTCTAELIAKCVLIDLRRVWWRGI